jgi:hypothetical protein
MIILVFITLVVLPRLTGLIPSELPSQDMSGIRFLLAWLAENPLSAALFIGPVLLHGVGFEEVSRVFFLEQAWNGWPDHLFQYGDLSRRFWLSTSLSRTGRLHQHRFLWTVYGTLLSLRWPACPDGACSLTPRCDLISHID